MVDCNVYRFGLDSSEQQAAWSHCRLWALLTISLSRDWGISQ